MNKFPLALVSLMLALSACQTTSLSPEEQAPVPVSTNAFSGQHTTVDYTKSVISFTGKSSLVDHQGKWPSFGVQIAMNPSDPTNIERASIAIAIDLTKVDTDADGLNAHLMKPDFFDTAKFPTASFVSQSIRKIGDNQYVLSGDLTMKSKTISVSMNAEITDEYLMTSFDVPRKEFGIGSDSYGDKILNPLVPVEVKLYFL